MYRVTNFTVKLIKEYDILLKGYSRENWRLRLFTMKGITSEGLVVIIEEYDIILLKGIAVIIKGSYL